MKKSHLLYNALMATVCLFAAMSCSQQDSIIWNNGNKQDGNFTVTRQTSYDIGLTRSQDVKKQEQTAVGDLTVSLDAAQWGGSTTRVNVTGDEYTWGDGACISLYMTKHGESSTASGLIDVPFDPNTYNTYTRFKPYEDTDDRVQRENEETVDNTAFFFTHKTGVNASELTGQKLDFYGYYPRPYDKASNNLYYVKTSIVNEDDAHKHDADNWSRLSYNFEDLQTDENLSHHDIMCALPERAEGAGTHGRYGNIEREADNNVQLLFKHMFCLLNIEIDKGSNYDSDGTKKCEVSEIEISGTTISTRGTLDVKNCVTTLMPIESATIKRMFSDTSIKDGALKTTMIVQPISEAEAGMSEADKLKRFVFTCIVDGIPFTCSIPDIKLEAGKKYNLKLKLAPSGGFVFRVWNGAKLQVNGEEFMSGEHAVPKITGGRFTVSSVDDGMSIVRVLRNGECIATQGGMFEIDDEESNKVYYDIVTTPSDWYALTEEMRIQYDAIWNDKYGNRKTEDADWNKCSIWSDLTGNGNDGTLKMFDGSSTSGWYDKGLWFDGVDDIVTYPGSINATEYTMEFCIKLDNANQKSWARITAEGNQYPCYYVSGNVLQLYAHGLQGYMHGLSEEERERLKDKAQLDFVFTSTPEGKEVKTYINGKCVETKTITGPDAVSIPIASLGNRIMDNTRALRATYYSFILYNKALNEDEIRQNFSVNKRRYGVTE